MCGIFAVLGSSLSREQLVQLTVSATKKLQHRGPDDLQTFVSQDGWAALGFARLQINDPEHGAQPMHISDDTIYAVTNGEIYNHCQLRSVELEGATLGSNSDCEVIAPLYEKFATSLFPHDISHLYNTLKGVFATVVVDLARKQFVAARDPIGVRAMYLGRSSDGAVWIASEAKAILDHCHYVTPFLPGCYYAAKRGQEQNSDFVRYYNPLFYNPGWLPTERVNLQRLHDSFKKACVRRLMSDVPVGVFISGGLDSSLVASVLKKALPSDYVFHSFSCGLEGSPDLRAAQRVADFLGTEHHVLTFTVDDGIRALEQVVYHLETYDITTIRASTPMFLLSKLVKQYVKVVLSGEGADEVFGGYLYFHNADSEQAFYEETVRRVKLLYTSDVLRGDRSTAAQSLELRVPFLDRDFLDVAMCYSAKDKVTDKGKRIEKWAIRHAFSEQFCGEQYLPDDILMRPKEQFSDGVGYNWIDGLKDFCDEQVTDKMMKEAPQIFKHDPPVTKEAYYYRVLFEKRFGKYEGAQGLREGVHKWIPLWSDSDDPSGRAQKFHTAAYVKTMNGTSH
ncbi:unnamed protein product [Agarophyton chilense]